MKKPIILCRIIKTGARRGQAVAYSALRGETLAAWYGEGTPGEESLSTALKISRKPHTARERARCRELAELLGAKTVPVKGFKKEIRRMETGD